MRSIIFSGTLRYKQIITARRPDPVLVIKKRRTYVVDFAVLTDHSENERKQKR